MGWRRDNHEEQRGISWISMCGTSWWPPLIQSQAHIHPIVNHSHWTALSWENHLSTLLNMAFILKRCSSRYIIAHPGTSFVCSLLVFAHSHPSWCTHMSRHFPDSTTLRMGVGQRVEERKRHDWRCFGDENRHKINETYLQMKFRIGFEVRFSHYAIFIKCKIYSPLYSKYTP